MKISYIPIQILPVEEDGFHLMITVHINTKPANLIIDTGASRSVFDEKSITGFVKKKQVQITENQKLSSGLGTNTMQTKIAYLESLKLETLEIKNYQAAILDLTHVKQSYMSLNLPEIHGVLGGDLMFEHKAIIDYKKQRLKLYY